VFAPRSGVPLLLAALLLAAVGVAALARLVAFPLVALAGWLVAAGLWAFLASFFRDPERPPGPGIVSAADGRIREVRDLGDAWLVSVFMNVTNVHVNRLPLSGRVVRVGTAGSGHRPAYAPGAARNVARTYEVETAIGTVRIVQITGVLARRLVSFVRPGATLAKGDRFGMIVLGSRVDVFLPRDRAVPTVSVGDRVRAGRSTIARELP
jgi:phosphatidylserine decarboxylase